MLYVTSWAIDESNNLWRWGFNESYGTVGDSYTISRSKPVFIGTGYSEVIAYGPTTFARKTDNSIWCWGINGGALGISDTISRSSPVMFDANGSDWADIQSEDSTTIGLKTNGTCYHGVSNRGGR
jgi:alpha-tubulin suppressor-like RCC1 family protein